MPRIANPDNRQPHQLSPEIPSIPLDEIKGIEASGDNSSAHATHLNCSYPINGSPVQIVYKENKHGDPQATLKEISFSEIARMLLKPGLTSCIHRVVSGEEVMGIAIDKINYPIYDKEESKTFCEVFTPKEHDSYKFQFIESIKGFDWEHFPDQYILTNNKLFYVQPKKEGVHLREIQIQNYEELKTAILMDQIVKHKKDQTDKHEKDQTDKHEKDQTDKHEKDQTFKHEKDQTFKHEFRIPASKLRKFGFGQQGFFTSPPKDYDPETVPYYFLRDLPGNFFKSVNTLAEKGLATIDMESLASVLTFSYTMEEDDLHRGNIGTYVTYQEGKPRYHFFKIDHDLLFSNSLMSFTDSRLQNLILDEQSYNFRKKDICNFPDIEGGNFYWPTKKRLTTKPGDKKTHANRAERKAFAALKDNGEFNRYKWKYFLKETMLPVELVEIALDHQFPDSNLTDSKEVKRLAKDACIERLSKLKSILLTIPDFRSYVVNNESNDFKAIEIEYTVYMESIGIEKPEIDAIMTSIKSQLESVLEACRDPTLNNSHPILTAIQTDSYRFDETLIAFTHNKAILDNALILAFNKYQEQRAKEQHPIPSQDYLLIIRHLIENGATPRKTVLNSLRGANIDIFRYQYPAAVKNESFNDYEEFKKIIKKIGNDSNIPLKMRKVIAQDYIKNNLYKLSLDDLGKFKKDFNSINKADEAPAFRFIYQIRSNFWFDRRRKGQFYPCASTKKINRMITKAIKIQSTLNLDTLFDPAYEHPEKSAYKIVNCSYQDFRNPKEKPENSVPDVIRTFIPKKHKSNKFHQGLLNNPALFLHVSKEDYQKAWRIIEPVLINYQIEVFSVRKTGKPFITLYMPKGKEKKFQEVLEIIESKLEKNKIRTDLSDDARLGFYTTVDERYLASFNPMQVDKVIEYYINVYTSTLNQMNQDETPQQDYKRKRIEKTVELSQQIKIAFVANQISPRESLNLLQALAKISYNLPGYDLNDKSNQQALNENIKNLHNQAAKLKLGPKQKLYKCLSEFFATLLKITKNAVLTNVREGLEERSKSLEEVKSTIGFFNNYKPPPPSSNTPKPK